MNIKITKPIQGGKIKAIASKSEAHRLLICAALAENESFIGCSESSEDIEATIRCLTALGAVITAENDGFSVTPIERATLKSAESEEKTYTLDVGESGATLRFLLPVCGALGIKADFVMGGRLPERPLSPLYEIMSSNGCMLTKQGTSPLTCKGQLEAAEYTLSGNISSQYISGLLLALPLLKGDSTIRIQGTLESRPYVDMTLEAQSLFGTKIYEDEANVFRIPGGQNTHPSGELQVGGDWSNAAFWLSAGAIGKKAITCTGLDLNSKQGDKEVIELLKCFGAGVICKADSVTVTPNALHGTLINAENIPDLVPVLAAVASVAKGQTIIRNAGRLRMKESDRLQTVEALLKGLGADITQTDDGFIIQGVATLTGGEVNSFGDHRIAMTAAVISTVCTEPVIIKGADAVNKSYPGFFEDFKTLGGEYDTRMSP
ncbi:MAG: 3-phosphoshikimate 1-carboxyvinyltransferase [Oscillospiraceae bacterium]|nr:3-phosphoshikimate 1-carboxyvinyltransferase [Oscillospiraceae bacterium]